jgi:hypothetical protein
MLPHYFFQTSRRCTEARRISPSTIASARNLVACQGVREYLLPSVPVNQTGDDEVLSESRRLLHVFALMYVTHVASPSKYVKATELFDNTLVGVDDCMGMHFGRATGKHASRHVNVNSRVLPGC